MDPIIIAIPAVLAGVSGFCAGAAWGIARTARRWSPLAREALDSLVESRRRNCELEIELAAWEAQHERRMKPLRDANAKRKADALAREGV